jgi:hypothetical protein
VSGSVAAATFTDISDDGKDDDFDNFERTCNQLNVNNVQALWDKAVSEVEADFKVSENRAAIITEAEKVRLQIFPWSTLPVVDLKGVQGETETPNQL